MVGKDPATWAPSFWSWSTSRLCGKANLLATGTDTDSSIWYHSSKRPPGHLVTSWFLQTPSEQFLLTRINTLLLSRVFLVAGSSLSLLHATPFWLVEFLLGNQLIAWWDFPCMLFVIFPLFLSIFILSLSCQFDYYVSQCVPPRVYPIWDSLCFLHLVDYFLSHVREVFNYHLFKYFLRTFL